MESVLKGWLHHHHCGLNKTLTPFTHIFVECTDCVLCQRVEVLERSCGKPHHQVQVLDAPGHGIEVVADWDGRGLVHTLVYGVLQVRYLKENKESSHRE